MPDARRPTSSRLLHSRFDWAVYLLAWAVFAAGFAAIFWIQRRAPYATAMLSSFRIVFPAALLGVGVIRWCERDRTDAPFRPAALLLHAVLCLAYSTLWIGTVNLTNNVLLYWQEGRLQWQLPPEHVLHWHYFTGTAIYATLVAMTYGRGRARDAERKRERAEARLLQGQLNPHFLFNALHALFALARTEPEAGEDGVTRLSRLLRYTLAVDRDAADTVTWDAEWGFTEDYLHLEALRLEHRLRWSVRAGEGIGDYRVPPLLLQPLVENAIRYAVAARPEGGTITVHADATDQGLRIRVEDDGPGADRDAVMRSPGIGLRATRARLRAITGREDAFALETAPGAGFAVTLHLPE
ncbi:MAG: histidine kinase [Gemmatimonadales bacterium]|nr:histidine kinase [Gemmatimonadales bacterium]